MTRSRATALAFAALTVLLCAAWFYVTSSSPDGLERVAAKLGFAGRERPAVHSPMAEYQLTLLGSPAAGRIAAALLGAALCFAAAWGVGRLAARKPEKAASPERGGKG